MSFLSQKLHLDPEGPLLTLAGVLGLLTLARLAYSLICLILDLSSFRAIPLTRFGSKRGAYALITGCTAGIGLEFAHQLADHGFNLVLLARDATKLADVKSSILKKHPYVKIRVVVVDFAKPTEAQWKEVAGTIDGLPIGILINNVGVSHAHPVYFYETSEKEMNDIVQVNVLATLKITSLVLPNMVKMKNGLILNVGSFSSLIASPLLATYAGSKAFLTTWTQSLADEVANDGITVRLLNTYFVVSALSKIRRSSAMIPMPRPYVRSVLSTIGRPGGGRARPYTSNPYWSHALLEYGIHLLNLPSVVIAYTSWLHKDLRRRALRKQGKRDD